jgi:hypothetical protein
MVRKCYCDNCGKGVPYKPGDCRLCWLYHNNAQYRKLWDSGGGEPGPLQKLFNFGKALIDHVEHGMKKVDNETYRYRLELCHQCPEFRPERDACSICGCNMKVKASWATQACPINKWGKVDES